MECAAECLKALLQRPDLAQYRQEYMDLCVQAWKNGGMRDSGPYMRLLQYLLGTIPATWNGSSTCGKWDSGEYFYCLDGMLHVDVKLIVVFVILVQKRLHGWMLLLATWINSTECWN